MDPLAPVPDLEAWLGVTFEGSDLTRAESILAAVSALIRSEAGQTWDGETVPDDIKTVALTVAARVYDNPRGLQQFQRGTGPFTDGGTYANPAALGLYLSVHERTIVGRYRVNHRGIWTLGVTRGDDEADTIYVPTASEPSGYPFPFLTTDDL